MHNIASHLCNAQEFIQQRAVRNFGQADPEYGRRLQERLNFYNQEIKKVSPYSVRVQQNAVVHILVVKVLLLHASLRFLQLFLRNK